MAIRDSEIFPNIQGSITIQNFFLNTFRATNWMPLIAARQGIVIESRKGIIGNIGF